jgi:hypothetical protein
MITRRLKSYRSLFEDINIFKKVKSIIAPKYSREQADKLIKDAQEQTKKLTPFIKQVTKGYRGNDADNITKLFIRAALDKELKPEEDSTIFRSFVDAFFKHKVKGFNWDTGSYAEFKKIVSPYLNREVQTKGANQEIEQKILEKESDVIFENSEWLVAIPRTQRASCILGRGSKWCTAVDPEEHRNMFDSYNRDGELIIFKNKRNENEMYQLHLESGSLMDINDSRVKTSNFIKAIGPEVDREVAAYLLAVHGEKPETIIDFDDALILLVKNGGSGNQISHKFIKLACSEDSYSIADGWDFSYDVNINDILSIFNSNQEEKLKKICYEILREAGVNLTEDDYEVSIYELLDNYPSELDGVITALKNSYYMAIESGTVNQAINDITNQVIDIFSQYLVPVKGEKEISWKDAKKYNLSSLHFKIKKDKDKKYSELPTSISYFIDFYEEQDYSYDFEEESVNEPHYGWHDFSEDDFWEYFSDYLYDETKKTF